MRTKIQNEFKVKFSDKDRNKGVDIIVCLDDKNGLMFNKRTWQEQKHTGRIS